jgi:transcriptional regulator with XRE-family HTH domain
MQQNAKAMIATLVKKGRLAKGYTQKELSELSNISIRSIQRIENGEIIPRSYTLKTIAGIIDTPFEEFAKASQKQNVALKENDDIEEIKSSLRVSKTQRLIVSVGGCAVIIFLAFAYIFQSAKFPETTFEAFIYWAIILLIITVSLFFTWRTTK